ncbi:TIGR02206 family membrane protein [Saccharopolyspora rhizosphaerae]|uniref:TIGR02206 family membrane protein n=1 Tax=Saccharopolyspora rhizosphaerae TaxID=2492662 RepID=A0A3R8P2I9_9PSEU|nr:TIGR02206 family membrane protein [Saccharopolyspora rhizosphaerae]RRO18157.1 TIGR02206 family membrane protein [Saccharopolyspora rhizosphaerae]
MGPGVDRFEPYGLSHWVLIALIVAGSVTLVVLGRELRGPQVDRWCRAFSVGVLAFNVPLLAYRLMPGQWDIAESLPLHLCDLAWVVAAWALWTRQPGPHAVLYFWGLTLTPQAIITPALDAPDFPHVNFVEFWGQHLLVIWAAAFLTWGIGHRPTWRGYWTAVVTTVVWGLAMLAFNDAAGTNYGFVTSKPENPSLLDLMGGWPTYLAVELVIGMAAWALLTWPWTRHRERVTAS